MTLQATFSETSPVNTTDSQGYGLEEVPQAYPLETYNHEDISPLVVIGGLLTVKRLAKWYKPLLARDTTSTLEPEERFIAPAKRGVAAPYELHAELSEELEDMYERLGRKKMFLVGHSLGGLLATMAAVERPDLVSGVASLGGIHRGYRKETEATLALRYGLRNPEEAKHLKHDSPFMLGHNERVASEWPEGVPFHVIATPLDRLVVPPHGYDVVLPEGRQLEKRIVVAPLSEWIVRNTFNIPADIKALLSFTPTEHVHIPRNHAVINYVDASRLALSAPAPPPTEVRTPLLDLRAFPSAA